MHQLEIHDFGPIRSTTIDVAPFLVLIGPQSSGKSTISKLIYFFLHVRDEVTAFVVETAENGRLKTASRDLEKRLRNRFVEFFGPTPQSPNVHIEYRYAPDYSLEISLDKKQHRYVTPRFSSKAWQGIRALLHRTRDEVSGERSTQPFLSASGRLATEQQRARLLEDVRNECNSIFRYEKELLFIPAARSLLSALADQMQYIHPHRLDYPMRQFVETINDSKSFFDRSLDDIVKERQVLSSASIRFSEVRRAEVLVKKILKGEYRHDREGGKLFISPDVFTKISFASSGQQEAVWILLSLFMLVLDKSQALVLIEEPEAHLFPEAQNDIVKFISFVFNAVQCNFVLTTHSPYLLSCVNNLIYASLLSESASVEEIESVIPRHLWLDPSVVSGYLVENGKAVPLVDSELSMLKCELIDTASDQTNEEFSDLLALERPDGHARSAR